MDFQWDWTQGSDNCPTYPKAADALGVFRNTLRKVPGITTRQQQTESTQKKPAEPNGQYHYYNYQVKKL